MLRLLSFRSRTHPSGITVTVFIKDRGNRSYEPFSKGHKEKVKRTIKVAKAFSWVGVASQV